MRAFRVAVATALLLGAAASVARAQTPSPAPSADTSPPRVLQLSLDGVVDPFTASYVTSGIADANNAGDDAVLLTIDTPGGLSSSMREITQAILKSNVPVICFTYPEGARAASAGTFIMMACPVAAMAPGTNIGAAHPVGVSGAIESEKVTNDAVASIRALAERNGRNADWAEQAVRNSVSISAEEALKINVIDVISPTIPALLNDVNGTQVKVANEQTVTLNTAGATIETQSLGFFPSIAHALLTPDFAFLFFFLGIGLLILEFLHPGVSVPGILGFVFLAASIIAFFELPVQLVGIVLLIASAVSFFVELKHPGLGIPTVLGVIFLVAGGLLLFNPSVPNARVSPWLIVVVAGLIVLFLATAVQAVIKTRHLGPRPGMERYIGREATVVQPLDPVGVIHMGAENWTALVDHGHIPKGRTVRVIGVDGLRLTVEPAELATSPTPETEQKGTV